MILKDILQLKLNPIETYAEPLQDLSSVVKPKKVFYYQILDGFWLLGEVLGTLLLNELILEMDVSVERP